MRPRLPALAILLISCLPVWAAEPDFVDLDTLRRGAMPAPAAKPESIAAEYLEQAAAPGAAAEQLLADEQAGRLDGATAAAAQAGIEAYRRLDAYGRARFIADARWQRWSVDRYNQFWLDQAARMLGAERPKEAEQALRHLRKPWSTADSARRYSLWGRLYLQQENYADAAIALDKQVTVAGDGLFDHYNFGITLLHTGQQDRGLALLDEIGYLPLESDEHRQLRDRVNLALGWHWLASDQGGTAREYFKRVQLDGPSSNMALLGLGWAELAADGERQTARFKRRVLCEKPEVPPDAIMRLLSDRYAPCHPGEKPGVLDIRHDFAFDPSAKGAARYQEALRPWQVLGRRGAHDPAVQEALLAAGFAQQKRRALPEAEQAYRLAIRRYEEETTRLAALEASLRAPDSDPVAVVGRDARAGEFAALRGSDRYVRALAARDDLQQAERTLATAAARLERWAAAGTAPERVAALGERTQRLQADARATRRALNGTLRQWLLEDLAQRHARLDQYHSRARLALALLYDQRAKRQ
jgi:hypothetical protein